MKVEKMDYVFILLLFLAPVVLAGDKKSKFLSMRH